MDKNQYYDLLKQWLAYYGFTELNNHPDTGADIVFKKSGLQTSKFGKVDTYCCVKYYNELDADTFIKYSSSMLNFGARHRDGMPLGFGAMLQVFPLLVTEKITMEVYQKTLDYCPKHFAAAEFPSVLDLSTGYLYYYNKVPLWGYAYYDGYRRDTYSYYSPKAWSAFNEQQKLKN